MLSATSAAVVRRPLPTIDTVLYPTDFSPCAQSALPYACALAEQNHATLHLLSVLGAPLPTGPLGVPYLEPAAEEEAAKRDLERLVQSPALVGLRTETSTDRGTVWEAVCKIAPEGRSVIVMGTHGRRGVRQLVLGSVAEQVFRRSHSPVMTVGPGACKTGPPNGRFSTILVSLDLVHDPSPVVAWAHTLALANQSRLIFFHAVRKDAEVEAAIPDYLDQAVASARKKMTDLLPRDVPWVDIAIKIGSPAERAIETAADRDVNLIVIGVRRGASLSAHAPWAIAHDMVCASPCPVLTIPHR